MKIDYRKEKSVMGSLIAYYRKKQEKTVNEILYNTGAFYHEFCLKCQKCKKAEKICSDKTLRKIESGEVVSNDCIYMRICENLGLKVLFNRSDFLKLEQFEEVLYTLLCEHYIPKLMALHDTIHSSIKQYHQQLYVWEMLSLYLDILDFVLYQKIPSDKQIRLYLELSSHTENKNHELLCFFLCKLSFYNNELLLMREELLDNCRQYFDKPLFFSIYVMHLSSDLLEGHFILKKMLNEKEYSYYQTYLIYDGLAYTELNLGAFEQAYASLNQCIRLMEKDNYFTIPQMNKCTRNIGMVAYCLKKYDEVIKNMMLIKKQSTQANWHVQCVLLYHSLEETNQIEELKKILLSQDLSSLSDVEKKITLYYKKKHCQFKECSKKQLCELEEYICDEIKPIANRMGDLAKGIFKEELLQLVALTSNYKKLYLFEKEE